MKMGDSSKSSPHFLATSAKISLDFRSRHFCEQNMLGLIALLVTMPSTQGQEKQNLSFLLGKLSLALTFGWLSII